MTTRKEALVTLGILLVFTWALSLWGIDFFLISGHFPMRMKLAMGGVYSGWVVLMLALAYGPLLRRK